MTAAKKKIIAPPPEVLENEYEEDSNGDDIDSSPEEEETFSTQEAKDSGPLFSQSPEFKNPFQRSTDILMKVLQNEITTSLIDNPTSVAYIKVKSSGDNIMARTILTGDIFLLINPCSVRLVEQEISTFDEKGNAKTVKGYKPIFIPINGTFGMSESIPFDKGDVQFITKASPFMASEYEKVYPVAESPLKDYVVALKKDLEAIKAAASSSNNDDEPVQVLDDGRSIRVIHRGNKSSIN